MRVPLKKRNVPRECDIETGQRLALGGLTMTVEHFEVNLLRELTVPRHVVLHGMRSEKPDPESLARTKWGLNLRAPGPRRTRQQAVRP